jgi:hypothetical protein
MTDQELNTIIATDIMGWKCGQIYSAIGWVDAWNPSTIIAKDYIPQSEYNPSTDITQAWEAALKFRQSNPNVPIVIQYTATHVSAAKALCLALASAVGKGE